jgi:hypothetical protein
LQLWGGSRHLSGQRSSQLSGPSSAARRRSTAFVALSR